MGAMFEGRASNVNKATAVPITMLTYALPFRKFVEFNKCLSSVAFLDPSVNIDLIKWFYQL